MNKSFIRKWFSFFSFKAITWAFILSPVNLLTLIFIANRERNDPK